ncbi:MAG: hypothetical protein ACRELB_16990 [Polyangiaceae bacterium]
MNLFEAEYPFQLQQVIDHARRFIALLSSADAAPQSERSRVWLTGRAQEIEMVLGSLVGDWRGGRLPERAAARAIASYLNAMHMGAEQHLGTGSEDACCQGDAASTIPQTAYGGEDPATADTLPGCPGALGGSRGAGA